MNIKKSNIITAILCALTLSATSFYSGYAAANTTSGIQYSSQGKIVFDNGTEEPADDVVFDAADFRVIDNMVMDGKTSIKTELNKYGSIEINEDIPEFNMLAASVAAISDGTDATSGNILSGKKALVGKNIVTGSMADHSGTSTSTSQIKENGTTAEITIPGGYYDENSKITVPIDVIKKLPAIDNLAADRYNAGYNAGRAAGKTISVYLSGSAEYTDGSWKGRAEATIAGQQLTAHAGQSLNTTITVY